MKNIKIKNFFFLIFFLSFFNLAFIEYCHALNVSVHIPEKYAEVEAGERLYFEVEVKYPENARRKDLRFNYEIKRSGEIISQSKSLKAIETQISFIDYIVIPENTKKGMYSLNLTVNDYSALNENVSASFHIIGGKWKQLQVYFFILLGVIALVGGLLYREISYLSKNRR